MKTILIFGGTGGIGGGVAAYFSARGWNVLLPVRDLEKSEAQKLMQLPHAQVAQCDAGDNASVLHYLHALLDAGVTIDRVFQATGTFLWDDGYPGPTIPGTPEQQQQKAERLLREANLDTKERTTAALEQLFDTRRMDMDIISSHAASFGPDHPFRNGPFKQEAYCSVMRDVSSFGKRLNESGRFHSVRVWETDLVDTAMTRRAFPPERAGDIDWDRVQKPQQYVEKICAGADH